MEVGAKVAELYVGPCMAMPVVFESRASHPTSFYNGHAEQPAIVTRAWSESCVNVKVLPDCGAPFDATSVAFFQWRKAALAALDAKQVTMACWPVYGDVEVDVQAAQQG